jgi:hypothetical protein
MRQIFALALVCSAISTAAQAEVAPQGGRFRPFIGVGYTTGGNTLLRIVPRDSTDTSKETDISAGGGLVLQLGMDYRLGGLPLAIQGSIGLHNDQDNSQTGERYSFRRYPVELQLRWMTNERWRMGFGARKATHSVLSIVNGTSGAEVLSINERYRLHSNIGVFLEAEYAITPAFAMKMRYVHEKFKTDADNGAIQTYDGSHLGLIGAYYFN